MQREIDITRNIRIIENIKAELLEEVANMYKVLSQGVIQEAQDVISESMAQMILNTYILGKRLGVQPQYIDKKLKEKIGESIKQNIEVEKYYKDISDIKEYFEIWFRSWL